MSLAHNKPKTFFVMKILSTRNGFCECMFVSLGALNVLTVPVAQQMSETLVQFSYEVQLPVNATHTYRVCIIFV